MRMKLYSKRNIFQISDEFIKLVNETLREYEQNFYSFNRC